MLAAFCSIASATPLGYERRRPEETLLYKTVQNHWRPFDADVQGGAIGDGLPAFIRAEFEAFLRCGILAHGFVRVRCDECAHSRVVAFSCRRRGFCPSCIGRRMNETAAHLVDDVIPHVPVRQWVLTVPHGLRFAMAREPMVASAVLKIFLAAITWSMRRRMRKLKVQGVIKTGAVTVIQRFDSAMALNVHFHSLLVDGVYARDPGGAELRFHPAPAPTDEDVAAVVDRVYRRVSLLVDESTYDDLDTDGEPVVAAIAAASLRRLIATGLRRGLPVRRLGAERVPALRIMGKRCAEVEGFNVHANVRVATNDRQGLESLCRYISRPPLSNDRLAVLPGGNLTLRLKRAWSDGTTHLMFSPGEFIEKLIPLIPRPRSHIVRYHGVLAPASGWRAEVVPACPAPGMEADVSGQPRKKEEKDQGQIRIPWADLLRRVFRIDVLECVRCGGRMRVLAAVMKKEAVIAILAHLALQTEAPIVAAARAPPEPEWTEGGRQVDEWSESEWG